MNKRNDYTCEFIFAKCPYSSSLSQALGKPAGINWETVWSFQSFYRMSFKLHSDLTVETSKKWNSKSRKAGIAIKSPNKWGSTFFPSTWPMNSQTLSHSRMFTLGRKNWQTEWMNEWDWGKLFYLLFENVIMAKYM